jgi:hypothetical protein
MTSNTRILGSLRSADGKGVVRMQDRFDTDIDDLWSALTDPRRLARWLGDVEGDLRLGGWRLAAVGESRQPAVPFNANRNPGARQGTGVEAPTGLGAAQPRRRCETVTVDVSRQE